MMWIWIALAFALGVVVGLAASSAMWVIVWCNLADKP